MTDKLRDQISRLRNLSPELNAVTDDAARVVQAVERFLNEECSIGIPATIRFKSSGDDNTVLEEYWLNYDRYDGKFKLFVTEVTLINGMADHSKDTAWASCPRDIKLASFQAIPQLLTAITEKAEKAIKETKGASKTITDLLSAFASKGDRA